MNEADLDDFRDAWPQFLGHPFDPPRRVAADPSRIRKPLQDLADILVTRGLIEETVWIRTLSHPQMEFGQFATGPSPYVGPLTWGQRRETQGFSVNALPQRERSIDQRACIVERNQPRRQNACRSSHGRRDRFRPRVRHAVGMVCRHAKHDIVRRKDPIRETKRRQRRSRPRNAVPREDRIHHSRAKIHLGVDGLAAQRRRGGQGVGVCCSGWVGLSVRHGAPARHSSGTPWLLAPDTVRGRLPRQKPPKTCPPCQAPARQSIPFGPPRRR